MKNVQFIRSIVQLFSLLSLIFFFTASSSPYSKPLFLVGLILLGCFYCGWLCPFGSIQEWSGFIGKKLFKKQFVVPPKIDRALSFIRYFLLIIPAILFIQEFDARSGFNNWVSGKELVLATIISVLFFITTAFFIERPFCRWFCPHGAFYGIISFLRICTIKRNEHICIQCKRCNKACPMGIQVSQSLEVINSQCINCLKCISHCPTKKPSLSIGLRNFLSPRSAVYILIPLFYGLFLAIQKYWFT